MKMTEFKKTKCVSDKVWNVQNVKIKNVKIKKFENEKMSKWRFKLHAENNVIMSNVKNCENDKMWKCDIKRYK